MTTAQLQRPLFKKDTARFAAWKTFHAANPQVFQLFVRFALEAVSLGRSHFGARIIGERIRWYTSIETTGSEFKISDHHWPYWARLAAAIHPELANVFEFRDSNFDSSVDDIVEFHRSITVSVPQPCAEQPLLGS